MKHGSGIRMCPCKECTSARESLPFFRCGNVFVCHCAVCRASSTEITLFWTFL